MRCCAPAGGAPPPDLQVHFSSLSSPRPGQVGPFRTCNGPPVGERRAGEGAWGDCCSGRGAAIAPQIGPGPPADRNSACSQPSRGGGGRVSAGRRQED
eukprot:scaffold52946_cov53-Phaeocystis_antarctica.AAC.2